MTTIKEIEELVGCKIYPTNMFSGTQLIEIVKKAKLQTKKECIKDEIEFLDYVLREININPTIERLIHVRIMKLKGKQEVGE